MKRHNFIDKDRNLKLIRGEYPFNSMASRVKMVIMSSEPQQPLSSAGTIRESSLFILF